MLSAILSVGHELKFELRNGRRVSGALYGDESLKHVIFYFHGFPGSRLEAAVAHEAAQKLGISLVALDRPGLGRSDPDNQRSILSWVDDVLAVALNLKIKRFSVLGVSGGGPYAAACAAHMSEELCSAAIVSGLGPVCDVPSLRGMAWTHRLLLNLGLLTPPLAEQFVRMISSACRKKTLQMVRFLKSILSEADHNILSDPEVARVLQRNFAEAFSQGTQGIVKEFNLYVSSWGFDLKAIKHQVLLWHGEADWCVPSSMGQYMAKCIPNCEAVFVQGVGHFMVIPWIEKILERVKRDL